MRGERMSHRVACGPLGDGRLANGVLELALHGGFVEVMASDAAGAWMRAKRGGRGMTIDPIQTFGSKPSHTFAALQKRGGGEKILPCPFASGIGPLAQQRFRHVDIARTDCEILEVLFMGGCEVLFERLFQGLWQSDDTVFPAFTIMDRDGALTKIEVFDAEAEGFHDPQPGTIHELGCKFPGIFETGDEGTDLGPGHHDGRAALATDGRV
jgi:hypothetical protein